MQKVSEVMTRQVQTLTPNDSIVQAAQQMKQLNVGALPICDGNKLVGMLTDRDITIRAVAEERADKNVKIQEIMSSNLEYCSETDDLNTVVNKMSQSKIRRLPVVNDQKQLVGILSLGDLADKYSEDDAGEALSNISSPSKPNTSNASSARAQ